MFTPQRQSIPSVRLFVSSTFKDFELERNVLQTDVFPELRKLCSKYGARFQAVDLRWGIGEDAALDQRTVEICLEELRRCQMISPVPNFLLLLGDRYGWQPLPTWIEKNEFDLIIRALNDATHDLDLLLHWYRLDKNKIPPAYRLRNRSRHYKSWSRTERALLQLLRDGARRARIRGKRLDQYHLSATAQEISLGIVSPPTSVPSVRQHVFCFSREFSSLPSDDKHPDVATYFDVDEHGNIDDVSRKKLLAWRKIIHTKLGPNMKVVALDWADRTFRFKALQHLTKEAYRSLASVIEDDLKRLRRISPEQAEVERHLDFINRRLTSVFGRRREIEVIAEYASGKSQRPFLVTGSGGAGKSSLMAQVADRLSRDRHCQAVVRFIGITGASSQHALLMQGIATEILQRTGIKLPFPRNMEPQQWQSWLHRLSGQLSADRRMVIIIDALDQLSADDQRRFVEWLPLALPPHIRIVVSAIRGKIVDQLTDRFHGLQLLTLGHIDAVNRRRILDSWLTDAGRTLQPQQRKYLLQQFRSNGLPLYFRLAFEEAVRWRSDQREALPVSLPGVFGKVLRRLEEPALHGPTLTRQALSYIAASRNGLAEDEILGVLSSDAQVTDDLRKRSPASPKLDQLPFSVWAHFYGDFGAYLAERGADNSLLLSFFHRILGEQVRARYLTKKKDRRTVHAHLAQYFGKQPSFIGEGRHRQPNLRKLSELSFHLIKGKNRQRLLQLLEDQEYRDAKLTANRKYEWLEEINQCFSLARVSLSDRRRVVVMLIRHLEAMGGITNGRLTLEDIHGYFVYRQGANFYPVLLDVGAELRTSKLGRHTDVRRELRLGFLARKANLLRRDLELDKAEAILRRVVPSFGRRRKIAAELSRAEYDRGYIHYLRGENEPAVEWLMRSAESSRRAGNQVGYWISRIVAGHVDFVAFLGLSGFVRAAERFLRLSKKGETHFKACAELDTTAERWVMNVRAHRFEHAYWTTNLELAQTAYLALETDAWIQRFDNGQILGLARARLSLLDRKGSEAAIAFKKLLPFIDGLSTRSASHRKDEALAWVLLDYGNAERSCGRVAAARKIWEAGMGLRADAGNTPYQRLIQRELEQLSLRK